MEEAGRKRALELIDSLRVFYGEYRAHKERQAYVVTVLFIGASAALLANLETWKHPETVRRFLSLSVAVAAVFVALLVRWQIANLHFAARMVGASLTVSSRWISATLLTAEAVKATRLSGCAVEVPHDLARSFQDQHSRVLTAAQIVIPLLIAGWGIGVAIVIWRV
jgi:cytosine/uracil/thiamine/allantoin permease